MLQIKNLHASIQDKKILNGINLHIKPGEVHAIMGPNGSGKSTLSSVIAGKEDYEITQGSILLEKEDLEDLSPEERAHKGLFLSFQYPVEIPGVSNLEFLRVSTNARRETQGQEELDTFDFEDHVQQKLQVVQMDPAFLERSVNEGLRIDDCPGTEVQMASPTSLSTSTKV